MKRNVLLLFSLFLVIFSCSDDIVPSLTVDQTEFTVSDAGAVQTIDFESNVAWTAQSSEGWCAISSKSGDASVKSITVTIPENSTYDDRSCTVTIIAGDLSRVVTIKQGSNLGLLVTIDKYHLGNAANTIEVEVKASVVFEVTVSDDWITQLNIRGLSSNKLSFAIAKNEGYDNREGAITIKQKGGALRSTIKVFQSQEDAIILSDKTVDLTSKGQELKVELKTNVNVEVIIPDAAKSWVSNAATRALRTEVLVLNIARNKSSENRSTQVYVKNKASSLQDTLTIHQIGGDANHVPHFYIDTDGGEPIIIKKEYKKGNLRIVGGGEYDDFEARASLRGRGNSTWGMPKKPYRIKLDSKASLLGLSAEKDWVLLQNYIDPSLMGNSVAMKIGQLLEMPFTHHMLPVDVTLNGDYIGSYTFTEHKEVEENRINVGEGGWLLELDTYFDEDFKFYSKNYKMPVMIQYPKLDKMTDAEATPIFNEMETSFNVLDNLIFAESFPNNDYLDHFDAKAFVNYIIVYTLTGNEEINHPKSTYIYKKKGEKYSMGPIWDFDWAFGYEGTSQHFVDPTRNLFWNGSARGTVFFSRILQDPAIRKLYRTEWTAFKAQQYPILVEYIKEYAETIRDSHEADQKVWGKSSGSIDKYSARLLDWLDKRVVYMDSLYN